ncbi:MAG: hypothetical protein MRY83_10715 [Flavobacteriales bacterium]|nr:hypothetical protein [Flavobacteriales bacterium]
MERISNSIDELRKAAELEINNFDLRSNEKVIAHFSEIPLIAGFPFKIILIKGSNEKIYSSFRQWDTEYDFGRWDNGIYNLNRLRIITETKRLVDSDIESLGELFIDLHRNELPLTVEKRNAIILDSSSWEFGISYDGINASYKWRAATEDIELFVPFIELMKNQHVAINRRH